MITQLLMHKLAEILAHLSDIREQIILLDNLLHSVCSRTRDGMSLIGLGVGKSTSALGQRIDHVPVHKETRDGRVSTRESLGDSLQIRDNAFLFPGMEGSRAPHPTYHLVEDQQCAVSLAHLFHCL